MPSLSTLIVLAVIIFLVLSLYRNWLSPLISFFVGIIALLGVGILSAKEVLNSFANEHLAVIVLLLIMSDTIKKSGVIDDIFDRFVAVPSKEGFLSRVLIYVSSFSAFFNNTPLVAMMLPYVYDWCHKHQTAPSKLLIPLSYAAILGGCATLVGTSTNLIVNGMAINAGFEGLGIFDFFIVGFPMMVVGFIYLLFASQQLLPDHQKSFVPEKEIAREFFLEAEVPLHSSLIHKTVSEAGLRQLKDVFLVEIIRGNRIIAPVSPEEKLVAEDKLIFAGNHEAIGSFAFSAKDLSLPKAISLKDREKAKVVEIVISYNSSLLGKAIKDSDFRGKYDGAIIAVHRNGEKLSGKLGEVELKAGDVLLVLRGSDFYKRTKGNQAFYLISREKEYRQRDVKMGGFVVLGVLVAILVSSLGGLSLFKGLLFLLAIILVFKISSLAEIRKGIDFNLIALLAFGLSLGKAMINSGAASFLVDQLHSSLLSMGVAASLAIVFLFTNLLSAYITNKAAVAIVFPVAISLAQAFDVPVKPFILIVAFGGAASFITPIGFQTNLMVYGPGGYSFKDFMRIGAPLTAIYMMVSVLILSFIYNFI